MLAALPAFAARPAGSKKYTGTTSQDRRVSARVTSDRKGLQIEFDEVFRCNNGRRKSTHAVYKKQRPTIRRDGTFNYSRTYRNLPPAPGFNERRTERQHVTGSFSAGGTRVKGRAATTIVGRSGLRCSSKVTFKARRRS